MSSAGNHESKRQWCRLVVATVAVAALWLVVLPRAATVPAVSERLRFLDERNIDPSAMFYTELDVMDPILRRLEHR